MQAEVIRTIRWNPDKQRHTISVTDSETGKSESVQLKYLSPDLSRAVQMDGLFISIEEKFNELERKLL